MVGGTNPIPSKLITAYTESVQSLSDSLTKLASGKRAVNAADDIAGFTKSTKLDIDISNYEQIRMDLTQAKTFSSASIDTGSSVYKNLSKMKEYAEKYIAEAAGANDKDRLSEYKAEFNALKSGTVSTLRNAYVDGTLVTSTSTPIKKVALDPQGVNKLTIQYSAMASDTAIDGFDITAMTNTNAIQTEIDNTLSYLSESKSYNSIIDKQINLSSVVMNNKESVKSTITDIDEAQMTNQAIDQSIRLEASIAMVSQGNIVKVNMVKLYDNVPYG